MAIVCLIGELKAAIYMAPSRGFLFYVRVISYKYSAAILLKKSHLVSDEIQATRIIPHKTIMVDYYLYDILTKPQGALNDPPAREIPVLPSWRPLETRIRQ